MIPLLLLLALPWSSVEKLALPPGEPKTDYTPAIVPNGRTLPYEIEGGTKVFRLTAEPISWEVAPGFTITTWGYNGSMPGPLLEACVGDKVKIYVTNKLPAPTTIHWHGMLIPCGMDGVSAVTQAPIPPGETWVYEFYLPASGTFMYHSHHDDMVQEGMGLVGMFLVHEREKDLTKRPDRDFVLLLHEWEIPVGEARPNVIAMGGFNLFTMNGKVMPATEPLVAKQGTRVWIRFGNLSAMDHHPIHLHGHTFKVIGSDGGWAPYPHMLMPETTVLVPVGACRVVEVLANNPGDWVVHCHMTHHTMNQMGHDVPNMIGVDMSEVDPLVEKLIPGFMSMGTTGMHDMAKSGMPIPPNSIPMLGLGDSVFGGMGTIFKVREKVDGNKDPGPYVFPEGTQTWRAGG